MSYLPKDELEPGDGKKRPTTNRMMIWLVAGGIGVYLIGTGIYGLLTK